jgi:hypothetical protein
MGIYKILYLVVNKLCKTILFALIDSLVPNRTRGHDSASS